MTMRARQQGPEQPSKVIRLQLNAVLQEQVENALATITAEQILAIAMLLLILSLIKRVNEQEKVQPEPPAEPPPSEEALIWGYLSQLQRELPEGVALRDLLDEANIQLVVGDQPVELPGAADVDDDDPFESFKRGWDDAQHGRTMSRAEFRRRMLEDAD